MKKIVVLGSNSFSGSHFVDLLLRSGGWNIIGVSRSKEKKELFLPYKWNKDKTSSLFQFEQIDFNTSQNKLFRLIDQFQPSYIINFAGLVEVSSSWNNPVDYFHTNCLSIVSLSHFLKDQKYLKKYLHVSTPEVYGTTIGRATEDTLLNPSTPYAASKASADLYLITLFKHFSFPVSFVRSTNVYGPGQQVFRIIPKTIVSIKKHEKIPLEGAGKAIKSYIHIRDVSKAELIVLLQGKPGEVYHISPDTSTSIYALVKLICKRLDVSYKKNIRVVADRRGQDKAYVLDSSKIRSLSWQPEILLESGIDEVVTWTTRYWQEVQKEPLTYTHIF